MNHVWTIIGYLDDWIMTVYHTFRIVLINKDLAKQIHVHELNENVAALYYEAKLMDSIKDLNLESLVRKVSSEFESLNKDFEKSIYIVSFLDSDGPVYGLRLNLRGLLNQNSKLFFEHNQDVIEEQVHKAYGDVFQKNEF